MTAQNNVTETVSTGWSICYKDYEATLKDLVNNTDPPPHAYYDAAPGCYSYDYCPNWSVYDAYSASIYISRYVTPIILTIGIIGNFMILAMLQTKDLKDMPSRPFFQALAVTDNIMLLSGALIWCLREGYRVEIVYNDAGCKVRVYTVYIARCVSGWLIAALTLDRFISVNWPMKARFITYTHRVIVIASVYITCGIMYSHFPVYRKYVGVQGQQYYVCKTNIDNPHYSVYINNYFTWVELVVNFLGPFLAIMIGNVGMVISMRKSEGTDITSTKSETQASKRLTLLFIVISTSFMVTVSPQNINELRIFVGAASYNYRTFTVALMTNTIVRNFAYTNHAINFFLYCIVGRKFRSALTSLLQCRQM